MRSTSGEHNVNKYSKLRVKTITQRWLWRKITLNVINIKDAQKGKEIQKRPLRAKKHHRSIKTINLFHSYLLCDGNIRLGASDPPPSFTRITILSVLSERGLYRGHRLIIQQMVIVDKFEEAQLSQVWLEIGEGNLLFCSLKVDTRGCHQFVSETRHLLFQLLFGTYGLFKRFFSRFILRGAQTFPPKCLYLSERPLSPSSFSISIHIFLKHSRHLLFDLISPLLIDIL